MGEVIDWKALLRYSMLAGALRLGIVLHHVALEGELERTDDSKSKREQKLRSRCVDAVNVSKCLVGRLGVVLCICRILVQCRDQGPVLRQRTVSRLSLWVHWPHVHRLPRPGGRAADSTRLSSHVVKGTGWRRPGSQRIGRTTPDTRQIASYVATTTVSTPTS